MHRRRDALGFRAVAAFVTFPASAASADGGNGNSFCSNQGPPEGSFTGDIDDVSSYGNAGEVVSWFSQQGLKPVGAWGQTVRVFCDPKA